MPHRAHQTTYGEFFKGAWMSDTVASWPLELGEATVDGLYEARNLYRFKYGHQIPYDSLPVLGSPGPINVHSTVPNAVYFGRNQEGADSLLTFPKTTIHIQGKVKEV